MPNQTKPARFNTLATTISIRDKTLIKTYQVFNSADYIMRR